MSPAMRHHIRDASLGAAVLLIGIALPLTIVQGEEVRGGNGTLTGLWAGAFALVLTWFVATDYGAPRASRFVNRLSAWLPSVTMAAASDSFVLAFTKPRRFLRPPSVPPATEEAAPSPSMTDDQLAPSLAWIATVSSAEARGRELGDELLRARRSPSAASPFPNVHLGSVASKIKDWNREVAGLVDRSRLSYGEKIKLPIYEPPMLGYPSAESLSAIVAGGLVYLARLRTDRTLDPS